MKKILSISVAAYNLESMIRQCLDSFVHPEILEKVEVLVTDDGSKDHTREIVKEYEEKYPGTFKLIAQKHTILIWYAQVFAVLIMIQEKKNQKF